MPIRINLMIIGNICNLYSLINTYNEESMSSSDHKLADEKLRKKKYKSIIIMIRVDIKQNFF